MSAPRTWLDHGTALFLTALEGVGDEQLARPTALPGWTGHHLVAHVHFNALALCRLTSWAATGVENRMYAGPDQRAAEIEAGARRPAAELRELVRGSADALADALDGLSPGGWDAEVVTAQGRTVPATAIPWLRSREVFVHAVDLGGAVTFADFPADFTAALLADVVGRRAGAGEGPGLAAWLTGRTAGPPELGRWL